jgi:pimeloyl-ACP methyl ester carboxylesterase
MFRASIIAAILAAAIAGCASPSLQTDDREPGHIEIVPLGSYGTLRSNFLLWLAGVKDIRVANRVDCYRVVYSSTDESGQRVKLSGLLALPRAVTPKHLVSFQHGTTSNADLVPSNLSTDGLAAALVFAGNGYALIAPDYPGLGVSKGPHPYYVAADTARAVIDMIHSARHIHGVPNVAPFLVGFSEGGYASLATQRALEAADEKVSATAAIAGAFNLRSVGVPWTLQGASPQASIYMALWVRGYATRYGHSLDSALTPEYAALVPTLLDTPHKTDDIIRALPRDPRALFQPPVLAAIADGGDHWLVHALQKNDMGDWTSRSPIRLYYGTRDVDVPPEESLTAARQMTARGSDVQAIDLGPRDHDQSVLAAAPLILSWLQMLQ